MIGDAFPASAFDLTVTTFPGDSEVEPDAYIKALDALPKGSVVTVFTPDDTHFRIASEVVSRGHHVLVTKPVVKTLEDHARLHAAAEKAGVLVAVEVHKRWDPIYADARDRLRTYGDFSYLNAYMSQPKRQLETFRSWAGKSSDISYYLNSHHIGETSSCCGYQGLQSDTRSVAMHLVARIWFVVVCLFVQISASGLWRVWRGLSW